MPLQVIPLQQRQRSPVSEALRTPRKGTEFLGTMDTTNTFVEEQKAKFFPEHSLVAMSRKKEKPALIFYLEDVYPQCQIGMAGDRDNPLLHLEKGVIPGKLSAGPGDIFVCLATRENVLLPDGKLKTGIFFAYGETKNRAVSLIEKAKRIGIQNLYLSTKRYWHNWVCQAKKLSLNQIRPRIRNKLEHAYKQSLIMIKAHQCPSGVIMGGHPNYSISAFYPHVWIRDNIYILLALDTAGYHQEAEKGYRMFLESSFSSGRWFPQEQNDSLGLLIHSLHKHGLYTQSSDFFRSIFYHIERISNLLLDLIDPQIGLIWTLSSTHEYQLVETGYEVYANATAYRGLMDASQIAKEMGRINISKRWLEGAKAIQKNMVKKLLVKKEERFAKRLTPQGKIDTMPDICIITPALFGVVEAGNPLAVNSAQEVMDKLWDKKIGGIYRHPLERETPSERKIEGPWLHYSLWLADYYLLLGNRKRYRKIFNWVVRNIPEDSSTLAEHVCPMFTKTREYYQTGGKAGQPLVWAGAELVRTLLGIL